jgi:hypothetical protein
VGEVRLALPRQRAAECFSDVVHGVQSLVPRFRPNL